MYWPLLNVVIIEYQLAAIITWRIPGTGEPGGLLSLGSHRVGHDWSDLAAAAVPSTVLDVICILPTRFENHNNLHYKKDAFEILIG